MGLLAIAAVCAFLLERKKRRAAEKTGTTIQGADYNQKSSDYKQQSSDFTQNGSEYNQKGSDYNQQAPREEFRGNVSPAADPRSFHEIGNEAPGADPRVLHELGQSHH